MSSTRSDSRQLQGRCDVRTVVGSGFMRVGDRDVVDKVDVSPAATSFSGEGTRDTCKSPSVAWGRAETAEARSDKANDQPDLARQVAQSSR